MEKQSPFKAEVKRQESSIRFVRHNFDNLQALIRFADAKAGALTAFAFLLGGTGFALLQKALEKVRFNPCPWYHLIPDLLFCVTWIFFWVMTMWTVLKLLFGVVFPRWASHYSTVEKDRELMFWEHVLLHESNDSYREAIAKMDEPVELRNLADQVYELASIVHAKMASLRATRKLLLYTTVGWFLAMLASVYLIRWRN